MKHDQLIELLARKAQDVLWDAVSPARRVSDDTAVRTIRALISTPAAQTALEKGSDTLRAFALRAVHRILSDETQSPRTALTQLWDTLDEPQLNRALGNKQNARINLWLKKPPAR
jgi:hypothetical protein